MQSFTFGVHTTPPLVDPNMTMQRADDVSAIQRMLTSVQTCVVTVVGSPGVGKSTLAALIYHRLLLAKQAGMPAPRYLIWLSLNSYTTLPDLIAAILRGIEVQEPDIFLLKPAQQLALLSHALQREKENALIVLDQFESLLHPETNQGVAGRGGLPLFLELLQGDLGSSRILLTSYSAPFDPRMMEQTRVRSYLVSRISIPEGVALLHQRGVKGTPEELSLVWQRCSGHVFALLLFSSLVEVSGIAPGYLSLAPEYQALWNGEVTLNLIAMLYKELGPAHQEIVRTLSLFSEPVPTQAVLTVLTDNDTLASPNVSNFYAVIERELQTLCHLSLVQVVRDGAKVAYFALHPMLRQFIQEHYLEEAQQPSQSSGKATIGTGGRLDIARNAPEAQQAALAEGHMQCARYYYTLAQQSVPPKDQRKQVKDVEPLISTIRHLCLGWHWQQACDLLFSEGLHESLVRWGAWNVLIGLYTALLPPFGVLTRRDEGRVTSHLAMLYGRVGELEQSKTYFEQALAIQQETNDSYGEAVTLANQGELYRMGGEWEQAHNRFERVILLCRQQGDQSNEQTLQLQCSALHNMGLLYHTLKEYGLALSCYVHALRLTANIQSQHDKGTILTNLGMLLYEQGQPREGMALLLAALQLRQALLDSGVALLERFLIAVEQHMGKSAYDSLCQSALIVQQQIFSYLVTLPV